MVPDRFFVLGAYEQGKDFTLAEDALSVHGVCFWVQPALASARVVAADNPDEVLPLLEILRLPLKPGLYEASARLIKRRGRERALSELERVTSSLVEEWPAVIAVYPPSWPELRVAGVLGVRAEGVCGVLALRGVV